MTLFLRRIHHKYKRLGKNRRKKGVWRAPKGRDNKMREKRKGYGATVSIGYRREDKERQKTLVVNNINDLKNVKGYQNIILGSVGDKKKVQLIEAAEKMKILFSNINTKKFMKKQAHKNKIKEKKK